MTTVAIKRNLYWVIGFVIAALILTGVFFCSIANADDGGAGTESTGCSGSGGGVCNPDC
jgi:hypothetical protein